MLWYIAPIGGVVVLFVLWRLVKAGRERFRIFDAVDASDTAAIAAAIESLSSDLPSAFRYAAAKGNCTVLKQIADSQMVHVDLPVLEGLNHRTALQEAAFKGKPAAVRLLIDECRAGVNSTGSSAGDVQTRWTALHMAVLGGNLECVQALLERRADPNAKDEEDTTPLMLAGVCGNGPAFRLLLQYGASPTAINSKGKAVKNFVADDHLLKESLEIVRGWGGRILNSRHECARALVEAGIAPDGGYRVTDSPIEVQADSEGRTRCPACGRRFKITDRGAFNEGKHNCGQAIAVVSGGESATATTA